MQKQANDGLYVDKNPNRVDHYNHTTRHITSIKHTQFATISEQTGRARTLEIRIVDSNGKVYR